MDASAFIELAVRRGYCGKGVAKLYTETYMKDEYTHEDFTEAYRFQSKQARQRDSAWATLGNSSYKRKKYMYSES